MLLKSFVEHDIGCLNHIVVRDVFGKCFIESIIGVTLFIILWIRIHPGLHDGLRGFDFIHISRAV